MATTEWFRRTSWTAADRDEFNARLKRCRGAGNKTQYVRIQALHLAEAGHHEGAIELLDRLFAEFPDSLDIAQAHTQKAESLAKLGQTEGVVNEYRAALQRERDFPNVRTNAWVDFAWFVVDKQLTRFYDEAARILAEFRVEGGLRFPAIEYRYAAAQALLADASGEKARAREFARQALAESAKEHSGVRYHPKVGLVGPGWNSLEKRLRVLAGS